LLDHRTWYLAKPEPPASVEPAASSVTEATFCHAVALPPPVTVGAVGRVLLIFTVLVASATVGNQAEVLAARSIARNCVIVVPAPLTEALLPLVTVPQVEPPSVDLRYW